MRYESYYNSLTLRYRSGFIHYATVDGVEIIRVMMDQFSPAIQVPSTRAAKILITKNENKAKV